MAIKIYLHCSKERKKMKEHGKELEELWYSIKHS